MTSNDARRVVASAKADEILAIEHGPIRPPFSNEALVKVSTVSLNRGELRRAQNASDGALQIGWDFVGTVDAQARTDRVPQKEPASSASQREWKLGQNTSPFQATHRAHPRHSIRRSSCDTARGRFNGFTRGRRRDEPSRSARPDQAGATGGVGMYAVQLGDRRCEIICSN